MNKQRRGLGSLIPGASAWRDGDLPVREVPVVAIRDNPYQPRQQRDGQKLEELIASIRVHGVVQPLVVRPGGDGFELIAGSRRLEAARLVGLERVPAVVRECTDREVLELALVENLQREDINCMEAARAYQRLMTEFGMTQEQVAERVGRSRAAVANTLRLLALPSPIQQALANGKLSEGHGRALLAVESPDEMLEVWRRVEREGLTVRQTEALARAHPLGASRARGGEAVEPLPRLLEDPNLRDMEDQLREALGVRVRIRPRGQTSGAVVLEYYTLGDLDAIFMRITSLFRLRDMLEKEGALEGGAGKEV